jgi:hypothetical protein
MVNKPMTNKEFKFKVEKVDTFPEKSYIKSSKFDAIIKGFLDAKTDKAKVSVPELEGKASYLTNRINQRIELLKVDVVARAINGVVYLEKTG